MMSDASRSSCVWIAGRHSDTGVAGDYASVSNRPICWTVGRCSQILAERGIQ